MIPALRFVSFIIGVALVASPSFLLLQFAYGVGEPPNNSEIAFFLPTLGIGFLLGGGLVLVGLPRLLAGALTPTMRVLSGTMIFVSAFALIVVGFSGSVTRIVSPVVLLTELFAFYTFIYPANFFLSASKKANG